MDSVGGGGKQLNYGFSGGHIRSLTALLKNEVEGIAINLADIQEFEEEDRAQLDTLITYEVPYQAYVFGPKVDQNRKNTIARLMFDAKKNPQTRTLFQNSLQIEEWYPQNDGAYNALRRYLQIVRVKPSVNMVYDIRGGAKKALEEKGDIIQIIKDKVENTLMASRRFASVVEGENANAIPVTLELSYVDSIYHFQIAMYGNTIGDGDVSFRELRSSMVESISQSVLRKLPIRTDLLHTGEKWLITYGKNDGLNVEKYEFALQLPNDKELTLEAEDILAMTEVNTVFRSLTAFQQSRSLIIRFREGASMQTEGAIRNGAVGAGFWDNLDNIWGVIGLLVAVLTIAAGSFFTGRKKRRFRAMLYESNDLLREYIEGRQRIDNKLLDQKEKINRSLEKGIIDENQFLILKHRLEDIDRVIDTYLGKHEVIPEHLSRELDHILKDGTITEKEFTRIIDLVKKSEN